MCGKGLAAQFTVKGMVVVQGLQGIGVHDYGRAVFLEREAVEQRLKQLSDKEKDAESRSICRRLLEQIPEGSTVCAYAALKTEVNLALLIETLTKRGDDVFLPIFDGGLNFRKFTGWENMQKGQLGISEPSSDATILDPQEADIILIPGRAFDRSGKRLGRGNGGYDLWIAGQKKVNPATKYWGVALDCQLVQEVPVEKHDQTMDAVVTTREFLKKSRQ